MKLKFPPNFGHMATTSATLSQFLLALAENKNHCKSITQIQQIHALTIKLDIKSSHILSSNLTSLLQNNPHFITPKNLIYSFSLSNLCNQNPVFIFNSIIKSLISSKNINPTLIFTIFSQMLHLGLSPDSYTLPFLIKACSLSHSLSLALQLHGFSVKTGISSNVYFNNNLMKFYADCGSICIVRKLFDHFPDPDLISWTTLIQAYVKLGYPSEAVEAFFRMNDYFAADPLTLVVVISACSQLKDLSIARKIQSYIDFHGFNVHSDVFLGNALVDMYMKCSQPDLAFQLFHDMPVKNVISWNSVIAGLAHQGLFTEVLDMFCRMQSAGLTPDSVTLVGVLNSCANLGALELGKWVHSYADKMRIRADGYVGNALVDMYAKCGSIDEAYKVFQAMESRDVYSYTAMIVGFAMHGKPYRALDIFVDMSRMGIRPDHVTFVGVLTACSHAGLIEEGKRYFEKMSSVFQLQPETQHYGCMVDLLGRAGMISEALEFINTMPIPPDASIWGSLLGACIIHAKLELGESVIQKLVEMEPERDGAYTLMSNLYSSANRWNDALKWRKEMKQKHVKKTAGCSSIEIDGVVHEFRKGEKSHPKTKEVNKLLQEMTHQLRNYGLGHSVAVC